MWGIVMKVEERASRSSSCAFQKIKKLTRGRRVGDEVRDRHRRPGEGAPTPFTILTGSSNQFIGVGPGSTTGLTAIAGYRFNFNVPSSAGASATLVVNQAGIG
jgi:hypothetical protein